MNIRTLVAGLTLIATLGACAPSVDRPSLAPVVIKLSLPASVGQSVSIQGRNMGGPSNSIIIFRADEVGNGGVEADASDVVSWSSTNIVVKVPKAARPGGAFLFVKVGSVLSNAMPYSINP